MHIWSYLIQLAKPVQFFKPHWSNFHVCLCMCVLAKRLFVVFCFVCLYALNVAVVSCKYGQIHTVQTKCCKSILKEFCLFYTIVCFKFTLKVTPITLWYNNKNKTFIIRLICQPTGGLCILHNGSLAKIQNLFAKTRKKMECVFRFIWYIYRFV